MAELKVTDPKTFNRSNKQSNWYSLFNVMMITKLIWINKDLELYSVVALKLVYFKVERGYPFMTYPGLISKLELKSPATVVLLDLS